MSSIGQFFDEEAGRRASVVSMASYYHEDIRRLLRFLVPRDKSVVEVGCGIGDTLAGIDCMVRCGVDVSEKMLRVARSRHPGIEFVHDDIEALALTREFDYVIMSNLIGVLHDVRVALSNVRQLMGARSRLIVTYYSRVWYPAIRLAELLGWKRREPVQNWLAIEDVVNLLELGGFEVLRKGRRLLLPLPIPGLSWFLNRIVARLPWFSQLCLTTYVVARQRPVSAASDCSVSIIIPTKNEAGNVFGAMERMPIFGSHQEFIYIDGHSTDGTVERIHDVQAAYKERDIKFMTQTGKGKANAVWEAMDKAEGDLLMILDSDLAVPPEELPHFYEVYIRGYAEFVNGVRLVYAREDQAMRFLNSIANHLFAVIFTWILGFRIKDTLCGTKVISREDYHALRANMSYFGDFDPFGDFQLIFGATKLNLKVADVPVHYKARTYGEIQIHRWRDGVLLLRMVMFALARLKFV